jgi:peroxiredoxin (alkyl hydroperoxide reductase subunit C)
MNHRRLFTALLFAGLVLQPPPARAESTLFGGSIFNPGQLKPQDSRIKVAVGEKAPDFTLMSIDGQAVTLSEFRGRSNVVISFIPAAWTPVCSDQWPGYNLAEPLFVKHQTVLLGISVDNRATLHAWTRQMGPLWFPVLSDFWPHGQVADRYGLLREDGMAERALIFIDKLGVIAHIHISDINVRPKLETIAEQLARMDGP